MSSSSPRARRRSPRPAPSTGRPAAKANVPGGPGPPGTSARCTASPPAGRGHLPVVAARLGPGGDQQDEIDNGRRSEEHTSELQSPVNLVCRLLLEKKETKANQRCAQRLDRPPMRTSSSKTRVMA